MSMYIDTATMEKSMEISLKTRNNTTMLLSHFSRVTLCDPIDGSPPGSPVPGILQARTLEWVAISSLGAKEVFMSDGTSQCSLFISGWAEVL